MWLSSFSVERSEGLDIWVSATDITSRGFLLYCSSFQDFDCLPVEIGVTWLAYIPLRDDIYGETFYIAIPKGPGISAEVEERRKVVFPQRLQVRFTKEPHVFIAMRGLQVSHERSYISVSVEEVTKEGLEWCFSKSKGGTLTDAAITLIVVASETCKALISCILRNDIPNCTISVSPQQEQVLFPGPYYAHFCVPPTKRLPL